MRATFPFILVALLLGAGIYVRFSHLTTHLTHVDDIGVAWTIQSVKKDVEGFKAAKKKYFDETSPLYATPEYQKKRRLVNWGADRPVYLWNLLSAVPGLYTYAPAQVWATSFLVNPQQEYRAALFWGRLPSAVLGVVALLLFYLWLRRSPYPEPVRFFALVCLTFSYAHIVAAHQMFTYSIGAVAAALALLALNLLLRSEPLTARQTIALGVGIGLLPWMQYQALFFLPALFLSAAICGNRSRVQLRKLAAVALAAGLLVGLVWVLFLGAVQHRGTNWNRGPGGEFLFSPPSDSIIGWISYIGQFFGRNTLGVLQASLGFVPEGSPPFAFMTCGLAFLFLVGLIRLFLLDEKAKLPLKWFLGIVAVTWAVLTVAQKITLSPTRHNIILAPFLILVICEGLVGCAVFLKRWGAERIERGLAYSLGLLVAGLSLWHFPNWMESRRDPWEPAHLKQVLDQFGVKEVLQYGWTWNVDLMPDVVAGRNSYRYRKLEEASESLVALVSQRETYRVPSGFDVLYREERPSAMEAEYLQRTRNGTNGFYFYVVKKKL